MASPVSDVINFNLNPLYIKFDTSFYGIAGIKNLKKTSPNLK
jgi:hypothetical protein